MAGYRIKLDNDIQLPTPFELVFGGHRQTISEPSLLRLTPNHTGNSMLSSNGRLRLYIGDTLTYEGHAEGSIQFGEFRKTAEGKVEVWLDPQYVNSVKPHGR